MESRTNLQRQRWRQERNADLEELMQMMVNSSQSCTEMLKAKMENELNARLVTKEKELQKQLEVESVTV